MKSTTRLLAILAAALLVLAACGGSTPETASEVVDEAETETETEEVAEAEPEEQEDAAAETEPTSTDLADMAWEDIVAQAQEEGEVAWFQWYFQDRFRPFVESFEAEYGIDVVVADGALTDNEQKLLAEAGQDMGDIDVLSFTFEKMGAMDVEEVFMPLTSLPEFDTLVSEFNGVDTLGTGIAWWGNQTGFAYDPNRVSEDELPQTFDELTAWLAANPQQFGLNDPNAGGASQSFTESVIREFSGSDDYFDDELDQAKADTWEPAFVWMEEQNFTITASNADSLTRLNDGEFLMVAAWEDQLAGLQAEGQLSADIAFYIPEFGMNGGANSITIPANASNPAAAMVFVDWLTSAETQTALNETFGSAPQRPDADDSFALVPADQRDRSTRWFSQPYIDLHNELFVSRLMGA